VTLSSDSAVAAFADKNVGSGKTVTLSGLTLSGIDAGNYSLAQPTGLADITVKGATVTANDVVKTYGDGANFAGTEFTTSGFVGSDGVTSVTLTSDGAPTTASVGGYDIVPSAAQGTGLANYAVTYDSGTLTVGKATLTAVADDTSRAQGVANPVFTISYTGFVNGDDVGVIDSLPTASTTATTSSEPGTYVIDLTGGVDDNYAFNLVNGTLTITNVSPPEITAISVVDGIAMVMWNAVAGREYRLQHKDNVTDSDWVEGTTTVLATGPTASAEDFVGHAPQRFYRVRLMPTP
jgi:hypothetical protein